MNTIPELVERGGKVALQQIGNTQKPVPVQTSDGTVYQASVQNNVWLVWVDGKHVEELLTKKIKGCDCNGGVHRPLYKIATIINVSVHETGDRPD